MQCMMLRVLPLVLAILLIVGSGRRQGFAVEPGAPVHAAQIVLLGTGPRQRFPHPRLTAALASAGIGLEVMDVQAACRTYNILVAEERKVAAALLFE